MGGSVIVIGAGLGGLSTGIYARLNGYDCRIFEHHSHPGGVAAWWKRRGYLFDGGIHFLMGHRPGQPTHRLYTELGILPHVGLADMDVYAEYVDEAEGRRVTVGSGIADLPERLAGSAGDRAVVARLVKGAEEMRGLGFTAAGLDRPPELTRFYHTARELWGMRRLVRRMSGPMGRSVAEYAAGIQDPWTRWVVRNLFMPEVPVWFVAMLLALLADGQLALLRDGCRDLVGAMEKRYLDLGGEVVYRSTVEEIVVERDRAVGVRLADGSMHRAEAVVSAADGRSTIFGMLKGRYVDGGVAARYRDWSLFTPLVIVSFGVRRTFPGEAPLSMHRLNGSLRLGGGDVDTLMVRRFGYGESFAPPGSAVIQVEFESGFDHWSGLRGDRARYREEKARVAREVLAWLERTYPGLRDVVDVEDVATPYTTWRYTRNDRGAFEGWIPAPDVITKPVPRTLPGLDAFYMAGQWVMPGGGVPPVLFSGRNAVQLLCARDGRSFRRD